MASTGVSVVMNGQGQRGEDAEPQYLLETAKASFRKSLETVSLPPSPSSSQERAEEVGRGLPTPANS